MLPKTISVSEQNTEPCVCCGGDTAVRKSRDPSSLNLIQASRHDSVEADFIECHVCGYAWYEIDIDRREASSLVNVVHDANIGVPGQPGSGASLQPPSFLVTAKRTSDIMVDRIADIDSWMKHFLFPVIRGARRKPMTEEAFNNELKKRFDERRAVACN